MSRIRSHLTYANVMATLAVFLVLGGGTALAAYVVSSNSQVGPNTISGHKPPTGDHANIIGGSVNGQDVANNSLTGADIANRSGVDTCRPSLTKLGATCAGSDGQQATRNQAIDFCAASGLRLPSLSEAITMAKNFDVPGVPANNGVGGPANFWTDDSFVDVQDGTELDYIVSEDGNTGTASTD